MVATLKPLLLRSPVRNFYVTSPFGRRISPITGKPEGHAGIDLRAKTGEPIFAAADGVVTRSYFSQPKPPMRSYGNRVCIAHAHGWETSYAHLDSRAVDVGREVKAGDLIGTAGNTGDSKGAHLHFELRFNSAPHDPMPYFAKEQKDA